MKTDPQHNTTTKFVQLYKKSLELKTDWLALSWDYVLLNLNKRDHV
jgi:hypothetical protein